MPLTKANYNAVDLVKFIMAIGVVIIHRPIFPTDMTYANHMLGGVFFLVAVPFFFISSSFFFFQNSYAEGKDPKKFFPFFKRLLVMYFLWTIIYLPCIFVKNHTGHYNEITIKILIGEAILLVKEFFLSYSFMHFWYLTTLMLSVAVIYLLHKKLSAEIIVVLCLCVTILWHVIVFLDSKEVYFFQKVVDVIPIVLQHALGHTKFAGGHGLLCVSFGLIAAKHHRSLSKNLSSTFSVICTISLMIFGSNLFDSTNPLVGFATRIFPVLASFFLFVFCLNVNIKPSPIYRKLRDYSILIYFSHLLILTEAYNYLAEVTGIAALRESNILQFTITLIFAFAVSTLVLTLKKRGFKKIKYLY